MKKYDERYTQLFVRTQFTNLERIIGMTNWSVTQLEHIMVQKPKNSKSSKERAIEAFLETSQKSSK